MKVPVFTVGVVTLALAVIPLAATAAQRASVDVVVSGKGVQYWPDARQDALTWEDFNKRTDIERTFVKVSGKRKVRLGDRGWETALGSFYGALEIIYQQFGRTRRGPVSDIFVYNTATKRSVRLGRPISTKEWEYWPAAANDGGAILFLRCYLNRLGDCKRTALLIFNQDGARTVKTVISDLRARDVYPGFAGGQFAAWTECRRRHGRVVACGVKVYDYATKQITHVYGPKGTHQYAPAIDETTGQIYYAQGHDQCGHRVTIRRADLGASASDMLYSFNRGVDVGWTMSLLQKDTGHSNLNFERYVCSRRDGSVAAIRNADTL